MQPVEGGKAISLYQGTTNARGVVDVSFTVPADLDPAQKLIVETSSTLGEDRLEQAVKVDRDYKILLTTDKPIYQPGQEIHIRALALGTFDRFPASERSIEFIIADGKGKITSCTRSAALTTCHGKRLLRSKPSQRLTCSPSI